MGWAERANPNSVRNRKGQPAIVNAPNDPGYEVIDVWQNIKDFICRLFRIKK